MEENKKETDIFDIVIGFKDFFIKELKAIGKAFLWLIRFKLKNWLVLTVFTLIGLAWAIYCYLPENRVKYAEFRIQVNGTKSFAVHNIVQVLGAKVDKDKGHKNFAKTIGLSTKVLSPLQKIEPFYVIDLNNNRTPDFVDYFGVFREDTLNSRMPNFLAIRMQVKGHGDFSQIQQAIVDYLRKDVYLKKEGVERIRVLKERLAVLEREIAVLQVLREKELLDNKLSLNFEKLNLKLENTGYIYTEKILHFEREKSNLQENLSLQREVVTTYSDVSQRVKQSDVEVFVSRMLPLILLGFIVALLLTYRKNIAKALKID